MNINHMAAAFGLCLLLAACGGGSTDPVGEALVSARQASALRAPPVSPQRAGPARLWLAPTAANMEALFTWAQQAYPEFFGGGQWSDGSTQGYTYRHYGSTGGYLAVKEDGGVWVLGPFTDDELTFIAPLSSFACQMYPVDCGAPAPAGGPHVTAGNVHNLLMTWTSESQQGMTETWEHDVSTGATGALISRSRDTACAYEIDPEGNVTYTSHGSSVRYTYEGGHGGTDTTGALRARLYMHGNTPDGQGITSPYVEVVRGQGLRSVSENSNTEEWCVSPGSLEDTTLRFPLVDGRLANMAGTWTGELDAPILFDSSVSLPPSIRQYATCSATIDALGNVTVSIAGSRLPGFHTYDRHMSQDRISTMFTGNAVLHPESAFALSWNTSGWASWLGGREVAVFSVYAAPLSYWDAADPSFSSPAMVTCRAMRS